MPAAIALIAAVVGLLLWGGPSAIVWSVGTIGIFPVDGVTNGGSEAHIGKEVFEALTPASTDDNATSSIAGIVLIVGIIAAPSHHRPGIPFWRPAHAVGPIDRSSPLALQATARLNLFPKVILPDTSLIATVASTHPGAMLLTDSLGFIEDNQPPKSLAHEIFRKTHIGSIPHNSYVVGVISRSI